MLRGTKRLVDIFSSLKRSEVCGVERALVPIWGSTGLGSLLRGYGTKFWGEEYVSLNNLSNPGGRKPVSSVCRISDLAQFLIIGVGVWRVHALGMRWVHGSGLD